jgi:hypothetical protein
MHSLADIACFQKWATARLCAAKTDAWQVFALHNLTVAIETTSTTDDLRFLSIPAIRSSLSAGFTEPAQSTSSCTISDRKTSHQTMFYNSIAGC